MPRQLIDPITVSLPTLSPAWEGLRIAHLTDLHITRDSPRYDSIANEINVHGPDLVLLTGDYMSYTPDEEAADAAMRRLTAALRPKLGVVGVFGNHDTPKLRDMAQGWKVNWLANSGMHLEAPKRPLPIEIIGYDMRDKVFPDVPETLMNFPIAHRETKPGAERPLRLLLSHSPQFLHCAGDMDVDIVFSGHTHGGQIRPLPGMPLKNACDLPLSLTSGLLRYRNTLGLVSRGVGWVMLPIRWLCPAHVPLYTLRRGAALGQYGHKVVNLRPW